jgi:SAM-dependent methyltransferase
MMQPDTPTLSYTKTRIGPMARAKEVISLFRMHADMAHQVADHVLLMDGVRRTIETSLGRNLSNCAILEIGPGQQLKQARFFAADNHVTAIDLDEILTETTLSGLLRVLRANGPVRFAKTLVRKLAGIDRRFAAELIRQKPSVRGTRPEVIRCDAMQTGLPSDSFDCVMSFSVFEHLPNPAAVMSEMTRLLRPGGVSHHVIHLYSSDTGAHDARTYPVDRGDFPYWCHLHSPQMSSSNCYVNRLTLAQWLTLLRHSWPEAKVTHIPSDARHVEELRKLRARGLLADYSDVELLTVCLEVTWRRPS